MICDATARDVTAMDQPPTRCWQHKYPRVRHILFSCRLQWTSCISNNIMNDIKWFYSAIACANFVVLFVIQRAIGFIIGIIIIITSIIIIIITYYHRHNYHHFIYKCHFEYFYAQLYFHRHQYYLSLSLSLVVIVEVLVVVVYQHLKWLNFVFAKVL